MAAYGQTDQPCSVSHPCAKICGDHPCAPGETYALSANQTTTVSTSSNSTSSNMTTDVGVMANAAAQKNPENMTMSENGMINTMTNGTMTTNSTMANTSTNMTASENATATTHPAMSMVMPKEQVASGTQPKDVKCESGFELVINQFNSRPACVKSDIASILVERGWGMLATGSP